MASKIEQAAEARFGLSRIQIMGKAYQIVKKMNVKHPFRDGTAGKAWFARFRSRKESLAIRKPQKLSQARSRMMRREVVDSYFADLNKILTEPGIKMDPTKL